MKTLDECYMDNFFAAVDAGELIPFPLDMRCLGCVELSRCPFKATPRFRSDSCYWYPNGPR